MDVFALTRTYSKAELLDWASDLNLSLGIVDVAALRAFFSEWADELRQSHS